MTNIVTGPGQVTPDWLTEVLRSRGILPRGSVRTVRHGPAIEGGYSLLWPLRIGYSAGAKALSSLAQSTLTMAPTAPLVLLLKVPRPDIDPALNAANGRREHHFYTLVAPTMPALPAMPCYDAAYTGESGGWHLLLQDLSGTHHQSAGYLPPPEPYCTDAVEILAQLHAHWWQDHRLGREVGELPDQAAIGRQVQNVSQAVAAFLVFLDGHIAQSRRRLYERLLVVFPELLRRLLGGPKTLLHGDAHWRNFLYPNDRHHHTTRIFDWQSCTAGVPTHDLAYMIARHWHPEPRRELLERLLQRYHLTLMRCGVGDYAWNRFWSDFRLASLRHAVAPATNWYRWGRSGDRQQRPAEWAARLERFLVPFDTLGCAEVLSAL